MKKPKKRDRFLNEGDELNYLHDIIEYHMYNGTINSDRAISFLMRFEVVLSRSGNDDGSIVLKSHWAIFHEARGEFAMASIHRESEINYIEQLFKIGGPVGPVDVPFLIAEMKELLNDYKQIEAWEKALEISESINKLTNSQ